MLKHQKQFLPNSFVSLGFSIFIFNGWESLSHLSICDTFVFSRQVNIISNVRVSQMLFY